VADAFVSYASEQRTEAREIAGALKALGFDIWYDELNLRVGDSLLGRIEQGLADSKAGVLLISREYLDKPWTRAEMDSLVRDYVQGAKKLVPIRLGVSADDVAAKSPILGGVLSLDFSVGLPQLVDEVAGSLAGFAPAQAVVPEYMDPVWRFKQGLGELTMGVDGPAFTLWELLVHHPHHQYPIALGRRLFTREDLLWDAAQALYGDIQRARGPLRLAELAALLDECRPLMPSDWNDPEDIQAARLV
jgi:hypothetical protein